MGHPTPDPQDDEPVLEVAAMHVEISGKPIVRGVSLSLRRGERVALIGPSGAGKSTLLAALAGAVSASGTVRIGGRAAHAWPVHRRARLGLRYLPQGSAILWDLTVADNLATFAQAARAPRKQIPGLLEELDLSDLATRPARVLSGGERRRLETARVLFGNPSVLLCDEPFAASDPTSAALVREALLRRVQEGAAILVADHHLDRVLAWVDRAVLLHEGTVVLEATPERFASDPKVRAIYGSWTAAPG